MLTENHIVHTGLKARKMQKKMRVTQNKDLKLTVSDNNSGINNWTSLGVGSNGNTLSPREKKHPTDRPRMQTPKPAEHVGVLKVPESLKA